MVLKHDTCPRPQDTLDLIRDVQMLEAKASILKLQLEHAERHITIQEVIINNMLDELFPRRGTVPIPDIAPDAVIPTTD